MTNSRWQMNRIGLLDFWYYDEEEFSFLDGRMLLRGSNGSGKSVTMQSFIPLILDGNMRPERLDPFGSRARKMENYLLEEGDEREERTGYLYLELKRREGNNYLTIGVGLRARKNKKLETWYFYIGDGRRIGKDFFLYKDTEAKIPYTRQELKNRIGDGGRVIDSQSEYMETVNRLVFDFDSVDKYKEMLDLLIQLRSPKLSKDFKPTVLNEILSNSLLMLSEDDLRPMSEAIENMDALKTNLDTLRDSLQAAGQIERIYDRYNQSVLFEKADRYLQETARLKQQEQEADDLKRRIQEMEEAGRQQEERYQRLEQEEKLLKEKQDSLNASDAVRLKEQETELDQELKKAETDCGKKESQEQEKKDRCREMECSIREQETQNEEVWDGIEELLEAMQEDMEQLPFDESSFLQKELLEHPQQPCDFPAHERLLEDYRKKVQDGVRVLREEQRLQQQYDADLKRLDERREQRDRAEREKIQLERQLQQIREELIEQGYLWERGNQELKVPETVMQEFSRRVRAFDETGDYGEIRELFRVAYTQAEGSLRQLLYREQEKQRQADESLRQKEEEIAEVRSRKELVPERSAAVKRNRERLRRMGIPFYPFYQAVDFDAGLDGAQAARLEEALAQMGILDALIIPAEYRSRVLELDRGSCDRYLFGDRKHVRDNVMAVLDVDNPDQDILLHQLIGSVLQAIGYEGGCSDTPADGSESPGTWVDPAGCYRLGVLEGTVSLEYEPQFIGARTRERARQKRLEQLQEEYDRLKVEKEAVDHQVEELKRRLDVLREEFEKLPGGADIRLAARDYGDAAVAAERAAAAVAEAQTQAERSASLLKEIRLEVQEICGKAYLTARLDLFLEAEASLASYHKKLMTLQVKHNNYRNGCARIESERGFLEELEAALDDIRYDLSGLRRTCRALAERLESVRQQMQLTNYEEIREILETCVARLAVIPQEREDAASRRAALRADQNRAAQDLQKNEEQRLRSQAAVRVACGQFEAEYQLDYVERRFVVTEDPEDQARKLVKMLNGSFGSKTSADYSGELQGSYQQNRAALLEYQLTMESVFLDDKEAVQAGLPSGKRVDLKGKYRGVTMSFKELIRKLQEDMEEKTRLLNDKDRELFEDILANTISKKIRARIHESQAWVDRMNQLMGQMRTSSGLRLSLRWKSKRAEQEEQLDTRALVALLQKDMEIMREEEIEQLSRHFRSKIAEARKLSDQGDSAQSFHAIMREVLDYRKWFEFQLEYQKTGEVKKELTDRAFFTFSGGEKAMSMYVPLFSAAAAKYNGAKSDAPRIISLDEAFAGVDEMNIKDMFRLMVDFEFDFIINSQILWGDYETVPALAIYQLVRPENARYVSVIPYVWNGKERQLADLVPKEEEGTHG